ncbi:[FeFe] hydrogenase, group A [Patescibacteria group bacterium]|nr:[FeFe] hydrogenase, group A [Patescibacteria group bacterium]
MIKKISLKINKQTIQADPDKNILEIARDKKIKIPSLCFHPDLETKNHCNLCLIKIKGEEQLKRACTTMAREGMEITTESLEIKEERTENLKKILNKHLLECDDCVWYQNCQLLKLTKEFNLEPSLIKDEEDKIFQSEAMVFDQTKCTGCGNCLNVCPTKFLELNKRGKIEASKDEKKSCINCGQCILSCPVGAIEGMGEFESLQKNFLDQNKIVVAQFAPSLRTSIGEEFGMKAGQINTEKLVAGLKKIGFDYVFDTAVGADFTTIESSQELIRRIKNNKKLPILSSCCPAWVEFLELNYPEFVSHLCSTRSPQAIMGGLIKNYWKSKNKIKKDILMVSIMPCIAKKQEIERKELRINNQKPVDLVLTTRELTRLFQKNKIDLKKIKGQKTDNPLGEPSGGGVIYGSSGGVFESALRAVYFQQTQKRLPLKNIKEIRGEKGIKIKKFKIKKQTIKICVVSGLKNAKKILEKLKKNPKLFDAIEVMACPGGCVGGGGQPLPSNKKIIKKRAESLYTIDSQKSIKSAPENPIIQKVYQEFLSTSQIKKQILHTEFSSKNKPKVKLLKNSKETLWPKQKL